MRAGLEVGGVATLLEELHNVPYLLVTVLGADEEHILSLHDNQIRHAQRGYEPLRAIDDHASGISANVLAKRDIARRILGVQLCESTPTAHIAPGPRHR